MPLFTDRLHARTISTARRRARGAWARAGRCLATAAAAAQAVHNALAKRGQPSGAARRGGNRSWRGQRRRTNAHVRRRHGQDAYCYRRHLPLRVHRLCARRRSQQPPRCVVRMHAPCRPPPPPHAGLRTTVAPAGRSMSQRPPADVRPGHMMLEPPITCRIAPRSTCTRGMMSGSTARRGAAREQHAAGGARGPTTDTECVVRRECACGV
jgi:hypothetical protein